MKKTYILYCCIISVILMPFKWFAPENMTDLSEWGFKCISNPVGIVLLIIGVLLIQAKRIEAKERIQVGIGLVAIKKDCQAIKASQSFHVPDQNRTDAPASGGRCSIH